jgi:ribonuclease VapC
MIAVDSSAIYAIIRNEAEAAGFARTLSENDCLIGAPTRLEVYIAIRSRSGDAHVANLDRIFSWPNVIVVDFTQRHFEAAREAFDRFGKGRGHPAQLNFGDCLSYAVAKVHQLPLLYKGEDFARTDLESAWDDQ